MAKRPHAKTELPPRISHYRLEQKLGEGGMGVVYRAFDEQLQRSVALKVILGAEEASVARARILREARASSALNHPSICAVYGVGEDGPIAYIVLEFIEGETLAARIRRELPSLEEHVSIAQQVADALVHAHGRGIVHRDLKSLNTVLTADDRPKVLDFGLARVMPPPPDRRSDTVSVKASTSSGMIVGTPAYMSPEVLRGAPASEGDDLWALGVMMYEMATGRTPFDGRTPFELSAAILSGAAPELPPDFSPRVAAIIHRALDADPSRRFADAKAFRRAFDELTEGPAVSPGADRARVRSLVVLPLLNLSGDPHEEYFSDGMTDAITTAIASVRELRVVSRRTAMRYKESDRPLDEIAGELRVDAVIEGSVRRSGDRVQVSVQLIRGENDDHMWAGTFDRDLDDVLELQMEVARAIVSEIEVALSAGERARLLSVDCVNPIAYESYLRGRHALSQRTPESLTRAIQHFDDTIARAPRFASAYASLAECHNVIGFQGARSPRASFRPAAAMARRALKLDPDLAMAYVSLGYAALHHDQQWLESEEAFQQGLRLDPNSATAHHWYALFHSSVGRHEHALAAIETARDLEPLTPIIGTAAGLVNHFARRYEAAIREYDLVIADEPRFWAAICCRALTLAHVGETTEALRTIEGVLESFGRSPWVISLWGEAAALAGHEHDAREALDELEQLSRERYVRHYDFAKVLVFMDERDAALDRLDRALAEGGNFLNYLRVDPSVDALREEPRFRALLADVYAGAPPADGPCR